jgi:integrase
MTLNDFTHTLFREWCDLQKKNTRSSYLNSARRLREAFGTKELTEITSLEVMKFTTATRLDIAVLGRIFNLAAEWKVKTGYDVQPPKLKRPPEKLRERYLDRDELKAILEKCQSKPLKLAIQIGALTGLRRENLANLKTEAVKFDRQSITVTGKGDKLIDIPVSPELLDEIRDYTTAGRLFPETYVIPYYANRSYKLYDDLKELCGSLHIKDVCIHTLRHSFATLLVDAGVDIRTIAELLGHAKIATTMRYAHVTDTHKRDSINLLRGVILETEKRED